MLTSFAPATGGFTLRAWTMPGSLTPTAHLSDPSTFGGMSYRWSGRPTILRSWTAFNFATPVVALMLSPVNVTLNRLAPINSP